MGLALAALPSLAGAHEFWIEPLDYTVAAGEPILGHLVNGQEFAGTDLPFVPMRIARFDMAWDGRVVGLDNRVGNRPALDTPPLGEGLHVVAHVTNPQRVTYSEEGKWERFAEHKAFEGWQARTEATGLPFREVYARYAKALVAVGDGAGQDVEMGLETEIVALANPYTDDLSDGLPVRVLYQGAPRPGAQVELFEKAPDGTVAITLHIADTDGVATLPVRPGHAYLADSVVLREPVEEHPEGVIWETLWAALTFAVPDA